MLRGVALLGILPVNAAFFAFPIEWADSGIGVDGQTPEGTEAVLLNCVTAFAELKFISIFSFLFGVGIALTTQRARRREVEYFSPLLRRIAALGVFGVLHGTLMWYGDILTLYAMVAAGCIALTLLPRGACAAIGLAGLLASWVLFAGASHLDDGGEQFFSPAREIAAYGSGSFADMVRVRTRVFGLTLVFSALLWGPRTAGLFLLGYAAAGSRWFREPASDPGKRGFRLMLAVGLAVGVPLTWLHLGSEALGFVESTWQYVGSLGLAAAYVAFVAMIVTRFRDAWWTRPFAAVGRTAFSCYIGQTVLMTAVFYAWGGGHFASMDYVQIAWVVVVIWGIELTGATLWLRVFRSGPLEWLWRSITYWRPQRMLRG